MPEVDDQGPSFEALLRAGSFQQKLEEARQKRLQVLAQVDRNPERELRSSKPWEQPRRAPPRTQPRPQPQILKPVRTDISATATSASVLGSFPGPFTGIVAEAPPVAPPEPITSAPAVMAEPIAAISAPATQRSLAAIVRTYAGFGLGLGMGAMVAWSLAHWGAGAPKAGPLAAPVTVSADIGGKTSVAPAAPAAAEPMGLSQPALLVAAPMPQGMPDPLILAPAPMADATGLAPLPMLASGQAREPAFAGPFDDAPSLPTVAISLTAPDAAITPADRQPDSAATPADPALAIAVPASLSQPADDKVAALPAPPPPAAAPVPAIPAVAIFLPPSGGAKQNARISAALKDGGFKVTNAGRGEARLDRIEVRYFAKADGERARQIAEAVNGRAVLASATSGTAPGRIEVWLASFPKATTAAAKPKATKVKTQKKQSNDLPPMPESVQIQILRDRILSQLN